MAYFTRRTFLKTSAAAATAACWTPRLLANESGSRVIVVHGKDITRMLARGIERFGGWEAFVVRGEKATLKANVAWASTPEQGGNTTPSLVAACVENCLAAGAADVVVPENPCSHPDEAFMISGIGQAVREAGGRMLALHDDRYFKTVNLPEAVTLKTAQIARDVLETACLINLPVAKHHSGAMLTLSMKNWMGSVKDRNFFHRNGLHQCIADCSTLIKPHLVIMDATRIMLDRGPRGPGTLDYPDQLIFSRDPVAADAYAATLFKKAPFDIPHIQLAHNMKIGCAVLDTIDIVHLEA